MLGEIEDAFRERDATEQRLRQFLADASHELRTPLTSIQGFAELFRLGADEDHVQLAVILRRIEEESARMKTLVEDLLLLARLDETRPVERDAGRPRGAGRRRVQRRGRGRARPRRSTLDAPEPVVVLGDEDHLRQAIAQPRDQRGAPHARGTPRSRSARTSTTASRSSRCATTAAASTPTRSAHVFDRFWQADQARAGTGAGLGLSIVAGIAAEHGGTATAANADDGGARFTLRLPLNDGAA